MHERRHSSRYGSVSRARMISSYFSHERNQSEIGQPYLSMVICRIFRLRERHTTISDEVKAGFVHFVSVLFIMSVNPALLAGAGYERNSVAAGTGVATGIACILSGLVCNLPFVIAPTTSTALYYEAFLLNNNLSTAGGNFATFLLGVAFLVLSIRRVAVFTSNLVPFVLKVTTTCCSHQVAALITSISAGRHLPRCRPTRCARCPDLNRASRVRCDCLAPSSPQRY